MGSPSINITDHPPQAAYPSLVNMDKLFICELCSRSFGQSSTLEQHKKSHQEKRPYKCIYCDKSFQSYSQLSQHVSVNESDPKAHKCSFCCLSFEEAACLAVHVMSHTDDAPYKCQFCGEGFPSSDHACRHEKSHIVDKPHKCGLCYRTYSDAAQLAKHFRVHTGIKPYKCDYCERTFAKSSKRTVHMRSHTGERPYRCAYCDKGFADSDKLNIHIRTHTGERPYACEYCQRSFARSDKRNQHTRNVHKKELASKFIYHPTQGLQLLQTVTSDLPYMNDGYQLNPHPHHHPSPQGGASAAAPPAQQTSHEGKSDLTRPQADSSSQCHSASVAAATPQISHLHQQPAPPRISSLQATATSLQNSYKMALPAFSASSHNALLHPPPPSLADVIKKPVKPMLERNKNADRVAVPGIFLQSLSK